MKKVFAALIVVLSLSYAYAQSSKPTIDAEINANWPDNTSGAITPALLRSTVLDIVASYVDWLTCTTTGGIAYWNNTNTPTCLTAGAAGSVLYIANGIPAWSPQITLSPIANNPIYITPLGPLGFTSIGPTGGYWPGIQGQPINSGLVTNIIRTSGGNNAVTVQELSPTGYSAINFGNSSGRELGAIGVGNPAGAVADYVDATFWESLDNTGSGTFTPHRIISTKSSNNATFTGNSAGTTLAATVVTGTIGVGSTLSGNACVPAGTTVVSGAGGGAGAYVTSVSTTCVAQPLTASGGAPFTIRTMADWAADGSTNFYTQDTTNRVTIANNGNVTVTSGLISLKGQTIIDGNGPSGSFAVGPNPGTPDASNQFRFGYNQNSNTSLTMTNTDGGGTASAGFLITVNGQNHRITSYGNGYSGSGAQVAGALVIGGNTVTNIVAENGTGVVGFYTGSTTNLRGRFPAAGGFQVGSAAIALTPGSLGMDKIIASASAPGAGGGKLELVCGTGVGTAKLIIAAGTSATAVTIVDNIGAGVSGC